MIDLTDKQQLINYLQSQGLYTRKKLGQNFLVDREALNNIIEAADIQADDAVIEIGPGLGVMTAELVKKAKKVIAVELDDKLAELLASSFGTVISTLLEGKVEKSFNTAVRSDGISRADQNIGSRNDTKNEEFTAVSLEQTGRDDSLEIINADILKINLNFLLEGIFKYKVVANIPYYITSKIIKLFLTTENKPESITMLVQKEVAERICALSPDMSVLALSVQAYGDPEIVDIVRRSSFFPAPEVDSAILRIKNIAYKKPEVLEKELFRTIKIGFASKRKTLLNNFSAGYHLNKEKVNDIISSVGIDPGARAEALSLEEWVNLTKVFNID